jgi:hypothetical protein
MILPQFGRAGKVQNGMPGKSFLLQFNVLIQVCDPALELDRAAQR